MHIKHLSLTNFRAFARLELKLPKGIILLVGQNAQGKTSLLESIYFLATFTSLHAQNDRQVINFSIENDQLAVARIVAEIEHEKNPRKMEIRVIQESVRNGVLRTRKEILLDGVKRSMQTAIGEFNAVIFLPQMTRVIENSPEERRRYLNLLISQVMPGYAKALSSYSKALDQRNALLKSIGERGGDPTQLDYWDQQLAENGATLFTARQATVRDLERIVLPIYVHLTRDEENLHLQYLPGLKSTGDESLQPTLLKTEPALPELNIHSEVEHLFLQALHKHRHNDIQRGATSLGPHRDELRFISNKIDLGNFGSRGQIRTALLALKMAEVAWIKEKTGQTPVLLLDEVLAELDVERRADLLDFLVPDEQALLTTTDLHLFPAEFLHKCQVWQIGNGRIIPQAPPS